LRVDTDLKDKFGNALESDFVVNITTEPEPAVSINSLVPSKGVGGTVVVINGEGFATSALVQVTFNGMFAAVTSVEPGRIVTSVPPGATTGEVIVTNPDLTVSNPLTFTVLTQAEVARGYESGQVPLSGTPNAVVVTPGGGYAYVASDAGADAVVVDPALQGYLTKDPIPYAGGLIDIASSADGRRMYAIGGPTQELVEIDSDPADGLVFNEVLATSDLLAEPLGIATEPAGDRAFVATADAEIQIWDVHLGSETYRQQIGVMPSPDGLTIRGRMAVTPAGDRLLALTDSGEMLFYDLDPDTLMHRVTIGADPRDVIIDPAGERAYVTHLNGDISVVSIGASPFFVQAIATSGTLRGAAISPGAFYLYATDRELDRTKIIDLDQTHATFRSVVDAISLATNPVDVSLSPDGSYAFSVLQGELASEAKLVVTTIGVGPVLKSIYPTAGQPGTMVVIRGQGLFPSVFSEVVTVDFNGIEVTASVTDPSEIITYGPGGFTSGPVRVLIPSAPGTPQPTSNALFFEALGVTSGFNMRFGAQLEQAPGVCSDLMTDALAIRPQGDILFTGCGGGFVLAYDIQPGRSRPTAWLGSPREPPET
jgi:DNA-binding beta-propeller fold protein YncE